MGEDILSFRVVFAEKGEKVYFSMTLVYQCPFYSNCLCACSSKSKYDVKVQGAAESSSTYDLSRPSKSPSLPPLSLSRALIPLSQPSPSPPTLSETPSPSTPPSPPHSQPTPSPPPPSPPLRTSRPSLSSAGSAASTPGP